MPRLTTKALAAGAILLIGCTPLTDVPEPTTLLDSHIVKSQEGAVGLYKGAITQFASAFGGFPVDGRPFLDGDASGSSFAEADALAGDQYIVSQGGAQATILFNLRRVDNVAGDAADPYGRMHQARIEIDQAVGALREYGKTTPASYVGELIALRGFLYLMFAEMYCSGVPFSRAVYGGDIILGTPESTAEMYQHAIVQFDSALAIATDSVSIRRMATIGKARVLIDLGRFTDAQTLVRDIPTSFAYQMKYGTTFPNYLGAITDGGAGDYGGNSPEISEANRLGTVGLDYLHAGDTTGGRTADPRVTWIPIAPRPSDPSFPPPPALPVPTKFPTGSTPITLAGGIEARLIEAEAALQSGDVAGWVTALNTLRATAISPAIPDLSADSTTSASSTRREDVLFRERAFWLYGEGHRLGDMRRLVRQYHRTRQSVFPSGPHPEFTAVYIPFELRTFSNEMNFVPPKAELQTNPNYHGCINRDA